MLLCGILDATTLFPGIKFTLYNIYKRNEFILRGEFARGRAFNVKIANEAFLLLEEDMEGYSCSQSKCLHDISSHELNSH